MSLTRAEECRSVLTAAIVFRISLYPLRDFDPLRSPMQNRFLRPLLIAEFLLAVQVLFTLWSEVGGQYHLDLMFWPWKLGLNLVGATLIVAITASVARAEGSLPRRVWIYLALLVATFAVAGVVTFYYHLNEPSDEDQDTGQQQQTRATSRRTPYQTRQEFWPRTIG